MAKVSVIVPVYNKGQYLRACLDSLVSQTLRDIEIICIDDKSTDDSLEILLEYAAKDNRIRLIRQETNKGVSIARNAGIQNAGGEFIAFVDADDFVNLDFYEKLYAASAGFDCVKGEIWDYDAEINKCTLNGTCDLNEKIKVSGNPTYFHHGFTSAILKREFINRYGLHFSEFLSYNEDPLFIITVAANLSAIKIVYGANYYYRAVRSSLSRNNTPKKIDDFCRSISEIISYLKQCDCPLENRYIVVNQLNSMTGDFSTEGRLGCEMIHKIENEFISFLERPLACGKTKVSVIVPVYNGEKYLRRTLGCLILQSLPDIEIICVDDKSTDGSLDILKEYQRIDGRIRIIDCPVNGGESKARNIGIRAALGEYIAFMDQDDRLDLTFYEKLYEKAMETDADIVKGDGKEHFYDGTVSDVQPFRVEKQPYYFTGDWWTAIYKRAFILNNHIELTEGYPLGADLKFQFDACMVCNKISVVHGVCYHHLMRPDSGDSEETSYNKIKSVIAIFSYILEGIEKIDLFKKDKDCYSFYNFYYLLHTYGRIRRCRELEGKKLCIDFIFKFFDSCQAQEEVLSRLSMCCPILADALRNNQKSFYEQLIEQDVLSGVFYKKGAENRNSSVACSVVVPYIDWELVDKYIVNNAFLKEEEQITYNLIDNTQQNKPLSVIYNEFLDSYDYSKDSWLIFMHSDFEFLAFPSNVLSRLDPSILYGPAGTKSYQYNGKMVIVGKGDVLEKTPDNTLFHNFVYKYNDLSVDTLDCQCVIMHSSLAGKYNLRFDEKTQFDLYVEDFCIQATRKYGIRVEAVCFDCAHHSSYVKEKHFSPRYLRQLKYLNQKYPDDIYSGTVTPIGGKIIPSMSFREFQIFRIRQEMLTGKKL